MKYRARPRLFILCLAILLATPALAADTADRTYESYIGKRFSIMVGSLFDGIADRIFNASEKLYFNNTVEEIEAVRLGKTDAVLMDDVAAAQSLQAGDYASLVAIPVPLPELDLEYGVFSVKPEIIEQYNAFRAVIDADGTLQDMQQRWLKSYAFDAVMPDIALTGENGTLTVAIMATYPPFTFAGKDGEFMGFDIEQMRRFAAHLGMNVEFVDMDFGAMLAYVASGKADIGGSVYITDERKQSFSFGAPDYVSKTALVVKRDAMSSAARDYTWFSGKKVGARIGSVSDTVLPKIGAESQLYADTPSGIEDVRNGRIVGFATDLSSLNAMALEPVNADMEVIKIPAEYHVGEMGAIAGFDNQSLIDEFNAFLAAVRADGTLDGMKTRWMTDYTGADVPMPDLTYTGEKGALRVATVDTSVPLAFAGADGALQGYAIELMNRFAAQAGYTVEYSPMDFGSQVPAVSGGRADMAISGISITEERKKSVLFTDSIYEDQLGIITPKQSATELAAATADAPVGFAQWMKTAVQRNLIEEGRWKMIASGLGITMTISLLAQLLGTALGCFLCWVLMRKNRLASGAVKLYSGLIRGLPIVVLLMISYYIIFGKASISGPAIAICAFALVTGASVAAGLKGAIDTIDPVEIEAARSMGFSAIGAFWTVTLPQAIKRALPAYCSGFVELVKATAIVGYIAIQDLTRAGDIIRGRTYDPFFPLILVAVIYLLVTTVCVQLFKLLLKKWSAATPS